MIEIIDKRMCCGCTACANVCPKCCITMKEDNEGFLYPVIEQEKCIKCNLCEKVCPIQNAEINELKNLEQSAAIVQHKDIGICKQSTAGGAFTAIAEYIIEHGGVVFGVTMLLDFSVQHTYIEKKEELWKFRNSKYVQSNIGNTYQKAKQFLEEGRMVCYSGTPCQIEGLRHYLRKEYNNLILVDVVCRSVPSPGIWKRYVELFIRKNGKLRSVRFRDKTLGYQYSTMELVREDGKIFRGGIESQQWLRMFFTGMIIRPSCTDCKFRKQYRHSDFTIWDCFNVRDIEKSFDEDCGTTRVLINSDKGKKVFQAIKYDLNYKMISTDVAVKGVKEMFESPREHPLKKEFFKDAEIMESKALFDKYFPNNMKVRMKKRARLFLNRFGADKALKHMLKK